MGIVQGGLPVEEMVPKQMIESATSPALNVLAGATLIAVT